MMSDLKKHIIRMLEKNPGFSDKELAEVVLGHGESPQYINQNCRAMVAMGILIRGKRQDGLIGNWLNQEYLNVKPDAAANPDDEITDKKIKQFLAVYLRSIGWETKIAWRPTHGIDIEATCKKLRWIIEVKGCETLSLTPINAFVSVIGEVIQRMDDPQCKYSIALPDIEAFRRLWLRLPALAKKKTGITALFINTSGQITEKD